jgi:UDP-glucose 4-epimerase
MGLEVVSLRYFNVYGPRQNPSGGYPAVIPAFIKRLLANESIFIYGDGKQTRDFVYVDDVAAANFAAMTTEAANGKVFNIGTGNRVSISHLFEVIRGLLGTTTEAAHKPGRPGEILHSVAAIDRAQEELNYRVTVDLTEGLRRTIAWQQDQGSV